MIVAWCRPFTAFAQQRDQTDGYAGVRDESEIGPGENIDKKIKENFFLHTFVTSTECYVGEPIMATVKAYSRLDANSQLVRRPSLSDFSVIEMVDAYSNQSEVEKYNGEYYNMHLIRKVQLFPIQEGVFTLETAEVQSTIQLRHAEKSRPGRSLRDIFRSQKPDPDLQRTLSFESQPVTIRVKPLPQKGQPEVFSGAVGNFRLRLRIPRQIEQFQAATVQLILQGTGNFPFITGPEIGWPDGFEVSGPVVKEETNRYRFPLSGDKIFEYHVQASDTGSYAIPPVILNYFDPQTEKYETAATDSIRFSVTPGQKKQTFEMPAPKGKQLPLHWYYFGIVALAITAWVVYQAVRKK